MLYFMLKSIVLLLKSYIFLTFFGFFAQLRTIYCIFASQEIDKPGFGNSLYS